MHSSRSLAYARTHSRNGLTSLVLCFGGQPVNIRNLASQELPDREPKSHSVVLFAAVVFVHFSAGLVLRFALGVDIEADPNADWDYFWQTLPSALLKQNAIGSIWHLHSNPPFFNLYGALFFAFSPSSPLQAMHTANMILGSLLSGMIFIVLFAITRSSPFSFFAALILALNPSLYLYEAFVLHTFLTAFLVTASVFILAMFSIRRQIIFLGLFVAAINLIVLTRSLYHLIILAPAAVLAVILADRQWKLGVLMSILISLVAVGFYSKNLVQFGFFGASSWFGSNFWKSASSGYRSEELRRLASQGIIDPLAAELPAFSLPSRYLDYGYGTTSRVGILSSDDYNNLVFVEISRVYLRSTVGIILHDPGSYVENVFRAFQLFSAPSSRFGYLERNADRIRPFEAIYSQGLLGQYFLEEQGIERYGSFLFLILPASILFYVASIILRARTSGSAWIRIVRAEPVLIFTAGIVAYTALASSLFGPVENDRFKFLIEPVFWAFLIGLIYRIYAAIMATRPTM